MYIFFSTKFSVIVFVLAVQNLSLTNLFLQVFKESLAFRLFLEFLGDVGLTRSFCEEVGQLQSDFLQRGILRPCFLLHLPHRIDLVESGRRSRSTHHQNSSLKHGCWFEVTKRNCQVKLHKGHRVIKNKRHQNSLNFNSRATQKLDYFITISIINS